jgi:hypothetical protein
MREIVLELPAIVLLWTRHKFNGMVVLFSRLANNAVIVYTQKRSCGGSYSTDSGCRLEIKVVLVILALSDTDDDHTPCALGHIIESFIYVTPGKSNANTLGC